MAAPATGGLAQALIIASGTQTYKGPSKDGLPEFEEAKEWEGPRKNMAFKMGDSGLGYYPDPFQTMIANVRPQLPEKWREVGLREEELRVDKAAGAGVSLERCDFGFKVEAVKETPGQTVQAGDVIVAIEGRLLAGLTAPQMQASFIKRRQHGARLTVASLEEAQEMLHRDPSIVEMWDASNNRFYYFHRKTGKSGWTIEELTAAGAAGTAASSSSSSSLGPAPAAPQAPQKAAPAFDLSTFLTHGFNAPKEAEPKKKRKKEEKNAGKDESDLARMEKSRWNDWNEGGRGGYTEMFLNKYKNCTSFQTDKQKKKDDKRLKGSVGPGNGMEYMAAWTGSKNSFN